MCYRRHSLLSCCLLALSLALAVAHSLPAAAVNAPSQQLKKGWRDSLLCRVGPDVAELDVQLVNDAQEWQLMWNVTDQGHNALRVKRLNSVFDNDVYADRARVELYEVSNGSERMIATGEVTYQGPALGLRLTIEEGMHRVMANDGRILFRGEEVPQQITPKSRVMLRTPAKAHVNILRAQARERLDRHNTKFNTLTELDNYLAASRDSVEGYWEYLDRDVEAKAVSLAAHYRLATVRNGDAIDIIYLGPVNAAEGHDGAVASEAWQPLMVKGRLRPTIFINSYDLEWADGARLTLYTTETYATLEARCTILTINFPLFRSSFRFRRLLRQNPDTGTEPQKP